MTVGRRYVMVSTGRSRITFMRRDVLARTTRAITGPMRAPDSSPTRLMPDVLNWRDRLDWLAAARPRCPLEAWTARLKIQAA